MPHVGKPKDDSAAVAVTAPDDFAHGRKADKRDRLSRERLAERKRSPSHLRVAISPAGTFVGPSPVTEKPSEHGRHLVAAIRQRIETRLLGRVRELSVRVEDDTVFLDGRCATFYTKQLAQHAALAVLEDERLVNNIAVALP
jgi:hypothetical protein